MPPLVQPLYYDENGNPVYADSVPPPPPVEPGMYEEPYVAPGQYAAPPPTESGYVMPSEGSRGTFPVPTGWQHGTVGTGAGAAGGMMTSYPSGGGGGAFGLGPTPIIENAEMRFDAPYGVTPGGGSLLDPGYIPREQGPGMYSPRYHEPGIYSEPPPVRQETYNPEKGIYPTTEPGMYEGRWERPGQAVPPPLTTEPGMYEPIYAQPGYYTPRSASTYYGGQIWPTPFTGTEKVENVGVIQPGPRRDMIQVINPATGERTLRVVPGPPPLNIRPPGNLGGAQVIQQGDWQGADSQPAPGLSSISQLLGSLNGPGGGYAPPTPSVALGPTSSELGYRFSQGDPSLKRNEDGRIVPKRMQRKPLSPLYGLFGGG